MKRDMGSPLCLLLPAVIAWGLALGLLIGGCQTTPNVPEIVYVPVERYKPLPEWATKPITATKPPKATTGREHLRRESALESLVDYVLGVANCDRRLLAKLDKGEPVDHKECSR